MADKASPVLAPAAELKHLGTFVRGLGDALNVTETHRGVLPRADGAEDMLDDPNSTRKTQKKAEMTPGTKCVLLSRCSRGAQDADLVGLAEQEQSGWLVAVAGRRQRQRAGRRGEAASIYSPRCKAGY
jgi:hypothetical protein